jgi:3-deoxy-manno-octulosonate cytidylyltransferase (CMP-KDO synthetase)
LPLSDLEQKERLEQIRLLEQGYKFYCVKTDTNLISVDTAEDLEKVRKLIK